MASSLSQMSWQLYFIGSICLGAAPLRAAPTADPFCPPNGSMAPYTNACKIGAHLWSRPMGVNESYGVAEKYCTELVQANPGFVPWRLPFAEELRNLRDNILPGSMGTLLDNYFWSASRGAGDTYTIIEPVMGLETNVGGHFVTDAVCVANAQTDEASWYAKTLATPAPSPLVHHDPVKYLASVSSYSFNSVRQGDFAAAALNDGTIVMHFATGLIGWIRRVGSQGVVLAQFDTGSRSYFPSTPLTMADGSIIVVSIGAIHWLRLDGATVTKLDAFKVEQGSFHVSPLLLPNGTVVTSTGSEVLLLKILDGRLKLIRGLPFNRQITGLGAFADGTVIAVSSDTVTTISAGGYISHELALDLPHGERLVHTTPLVWKNDSFYLVGRTQLLHVERQGSFLRQKGYGFPSVDHFYGPAVLTGEGDIVVRTGPGNTIAYGLAWLGKAGDRLQLQATIPGIHSVRALKNGTLVAGTNQGLVWLRRNGTMVETIATFKGDYVFSDPIVLQDGAMFFESKATFGTEWNWVR